MATATAAFIHQGDRDHEETHRHVHACRRPFDRCRRRRQRLDPLRDLDRPARDVERAGHGQCANGSCSRSVTRTGPAGNTYTRQGTVTRY